MKSLFRIPSITLCINQALGNLMEGTYFQTIAKQTRTWVPKILRVVDIDFRQLLKKHFDVTLNY